MTTIEMKQTGQTCDGGVICQEVSLSVTGAGNLEHLIDTFRVFLIAVGFAPDTAARVDLQDD